MRALVFDDHLHLRDIAPPALVAGEAIVRPRLVGICATDFQLMRGYKRETGRVPLVFGHEFVGTVVESADQAWIGRRVVGEINAACGACATCVRGDRAHCPDRATLGISGRNGAMAELCAVPIANLHEIPAALSDEVAVFTEPLAAALEIVQQTHIRPDDRVVVVGDGRLGLLAAQVLRLTGCDLRVLGRHPERWDVLHRQAIRATDRPETLAARTFDVVIDCTGSAPGFETARKLVRPRGRLVLKSTFHGSLTLDLAPLVVDEIQVIGSRCGPFGAALRLLERGLIETAPLLAGIYPLAEGERAFALARNSLKVLLEVGAAG